MKNHNAGFATLGLVGLSVALFAVGCAAPTPEAGPAGPEGPAGPPGQVYAAPGEDVASEIVGVTIGDDRLPVVTFTLTDARGVPLTIDDVESVRFLIARVVEDSDTGVTQYVNYFTSDAEGAEFNLEGETRQPALPSATQPRYEAGEGTFEETGPGEYTYAFGEALGDDYNPEATHVVGIVIVRVAREVIANDTYSFVPAGGEPQLTRLISTSETCNGCHNQLAFHGGSRRQFEVCILCHTPQNVDPESGNTPDMRVMIHRIHSASSLPSVQAGNPYYIVGFRQNVFNFSPITWTQDVRNCTTCHTGPDGDRYMTAPNIAACTACHDDVNLGTGENHPGGAQEDGGCSECHAPEGEEFDASITGAHVIPRYSAQVTGVNLEIISVEGAVPGGSPVVTFRVTDNSGNAIAPEDMAYLALTLAGPTTDYTSRVTEVIFRAPTGDTAATPPAVEAADDGAYRYTFTYTIPADATGTFAVGMEGYVMQTLDGVEAPVRVAGFNPVIYAALNGGDPTPRRQVVDRELCNACHSDLALHGTIRQNTEYCVLCHNPMATDEARRPAEAMPPTSINFRVLIHRVHRGEDATQPLQVYGFGGTLFDFSEIAFPGHLYDCETCHVTGSYDLPLPSGVLPTTVTQGGRVISETSAIRSVCTACHDSPTVAGHIELQTTTAGVETCLVCHGAGSEFDVVRVHGD